MWGQRARSCQKSADVPLESSSPGRYSSRRRIRPGRNAIDWNNSFCPGSVITRLASEHDFRLRTSSQRWATISAYKSSGSAGTGRDIEVVQADGGLGRAFYCEKIIPGPDSLNAASGSWPLDHISYLLH